MHAAVVSCSWCLCRVHLLTIWVVTFYTFSVRPTWSLHLCSVYLLPTPSSIAWACNVFQAERLRSLKLQCAAARTLHNLLCL